ncbi:pentatricopeptide repeat-containing protein At4g02750 [Selaginella moellendorffii]|uniref:pentatricopeptide repeat-containing protein At4g02750 n=1 Tax=Selaginella moellendorffii TaxID=88036 RepID=UPI000D1CA9AE|nr:pentatricopeptide repeat-containing protein At4g02750 [Selaginella moellendorffii]|eukprot:XP_002960084.2 pentatricopeptide repeat-containing protein At4g02750 [Selaginella moellendorffii]
MAIKNKEIESYASLLKSCGESRDLAEGKSVVVCIAKSKYRRNLYLANLTIEMYGKCGCLERAQHVFDALVAPNSHSWNILLTAYAQNGHIHEAMLLFERMAVRDAVSWTVMLKTLAQHGRIELAMLLFQKIPRKDQVAWNAIDMFKGTPFRDTVSWNIVIESLAHHGMIAQAFEMFQKMPNPNVITWTILVTAYAQLGNMQQAHSLFEKMPSPNVVTWTVMVLGYSRFGNLSKARAMFDQMPQRNVIVWNILVTAYANRGHIREAEILFQKMPEKNVVSWTAMIAAHARNGAAMDAIRMFKLMDLEGLQPDKATFLTVLDRSIVYSDLGLGKLVHSTFANLGLEQDAGIGNALVEMYGKWGSVEEARCAFESTVTPDTATWNSLIGACAQSGHATEARELYRLMTLEGIPPNGLTFMAVLSTFSRVGLLDQARDQFVSIHSDFDQIPLLEHYQCMIDLLGRSGWLNFAAQLVDSMPFEADFVTCMALLFACRVHVDVTRGRDVAERAFQLDPENPMPYVVLSSIYSEYGTRHARHAAVRKFSAPYTCQAATVPRHSRSDTIDGWEKSQAFYYALLSRGGLGAPCSPSKRERQIDPARNRKRRERLNARCRRYSRPRSTNPIVIHRFFGRNIDPEGGRLDPSGRLSLLLME